MSGRKPHVVSLANMSEDQPKRQFLTGSTYYLGWSKVVKANLVEKGFYSQNKFVTEHEDDALNWILSMLSLNIAGDSPDDEGPQAKNRYGVYNLWDAQQKYRAAKMNSIDPVPFLAKLDRLLAGVKAAGGKIELEVQYTTLLNGLHQEYYSDFIRTVSLDHKNPKTAITPGYVARVKEGIKDWYNATPLFQREKHFKAADRYTANAVVGQPTK
ncbi:hypothetical protein HDV02_004190 [Globomyces sp. JEL0801]|nr:hypothetical protein HDV02_004190 [Globomyces sp. JEL0801]